MQNHGSTEASSAGAVVVTGTDVAIQSGAVQLLSTADGTENVFSNQCHVFRFIAAMENGRGRKSKDCCCKMRWRMKLSASPLGLDST